MSHMRQRKKPFPFFLWHRRLGLVALVLVFILSITGIMLNHTESLKLDETPINSDLLLNWYGVNPQGSPINFQEDSFWITQWNQQIFFNGKSLLTHNKQLHGIAKLDDILAIALGNDILLIDTDGEVIELMKNATLTHIQKIGLFENKFFLLDQNNIFYLSDTQLSRWDKQDSSSPQISTSLWSAPEKLTAPQISQLKQTFRGQGLNLERVILDLHSGRIFNDTWGIYIMDASAILMILLGVSGVWVWWSRKLKIRKKKHYQKHHKI